MKKILEYNYYLFAEKFSAIDKERIITFVTIFQYLFIVNAVLFVILFFTESIQDFLLQILVFMVLTFFLLRFQNIKQFQNKYFLFESNWKNEQNNTKTFYKTFIWSMVAVTFLLMIINSKLLPPS